MRRSSHGPRTPVSSHEPEATVHQATSVPRIGTENKGVVPSWHEYEITASDATCLTVRDKMRT